MRIREDAVVTPTGGDGIYGLMESSDSVMITVLNDKNELYLIRTFSYPAASWNWELPGGQSDGQDVAVRPNVSLRKKRVSWPRHGSNSAIPVFAMDL